MTGKDFFRAVVNGKKDVIGLMLKLLKDASADYCLVGGLAVNAYVEPVVSLDLDMVVISSGLEPLCRAARAAGFSVERFARSVNLSIPESDVRIQLQTDSRYQEFIPRARTETVLGYTMRVAAIEDVLQGKLWAYSDATRRGSKRQKDLADIMRLVESRPSLAAMLPDEVTRALT
ncbi:MAG: hypothetical protein WCP22_11015 [Chlamydiota bacterium]